MLKPLTAMALILSLSGCAVGMAMSGSDTPNLGAIAVGSTRGIVETQLGSPVATTHQNGQRIDTYAYEVGNDPSAGRAIGHGVMDVLTLGAWEIVGTPIEGFQGSKHWAYVTYDADNRVTDFLTRKAGN